MPEHPMDESEQQEDLELDSIRPAAQDPRAWPPEAQRREDPEHDAVEPPAEADEVRVVPTDLSADLSSAEQAVVAEETTDETTAEPVLGEPLDEAEPPDDADVAGPESDALRMED